LSAKLRRMTAAELLRILRNYGFEVVDQRGSHAHLENSRGIRLTVPVHAGRIIGPGLLLAILRQAGIDPAALRGGGGRHGPAGGAGEVREPRVRYRKTPLKRRRPRKAGR
jgi:predicted RNA binding protein YcfA (HicA-like mRNA interferase family)